MKENLGEGIRGNNPGGKEEGKCQPRERNAITREKEERKRKEGKPG